eukprot:7886385-Pyramimonas_sp.AAC.1
MPALAPLQDADEATAWTTLLEDLPYNRDDARLMVDRCGGICARARSQVHARARKSIREWLRAALPRGAKKVHACLKAEEKIWVEYFETPWGS